MQTDPAPLIIQETAEIESKLLHRTVRADYFFPVATGNSLPLLLINDGQDMQALGLLPMLQRLTAANEISPVFCAAIWAGNRMVEYGTAATTDYLGRGSKAALYSKFIFRELIPDIHARYPNITFNEKAFAGFSLGGLSALDIAWNHPADFSRTGVFSGSLWWRDKALDKGYNEDTDRIMHAQVRQGKFAPGMKFFFEAGTLDETMDRNNNGIIDAIDDTVTLIDELVKKGYHRKKDIYYLELEGGRHDVATWARAMPEFLKWGWGEK